MHSLLAVVLLCSFCVVTCAEVVPGAKGLVQVLVVTRHGQRTPRELYPSDPWRDPIYWPEGWQQLTDAGATQQRDLGFLIRNRYTAFLPQEYNASHVMARSTNTQRTINSAVALLSGLYPGQSIPVLYAGEVSENLFNPHRQCRVYNEGLQAYRDSDKYRTEDHLRKPLYTWLTKHLGKTVKQLSVAESLYSSLTIEKQRGLELPRWTKSVYPAVIKPLAGEYLAQSGATPLLRRLRYGALLKDILWNAAKSNATTRKFMLYSGHDFTIIGLLGCLGLFDGMPPGFSSAIFFEVRQHNNKNAIEIYYRNDSITYPYKMRVKGCGDPCYVNKLLQVVEHCIPLNITAECEEAPMTNVTSSFNLDFTTQDMFVTVAIILLAAVTGALLVVCLSRVMWHSEPSHVPIRLYKKRERYTRLPGVDVPRYPPPQA